MANLLPDYIQQLNEARREVERAVDDRRDAELRGHRAQMRVEALSQIVSGLELLQAGQDEPQRERLPVGDDGATVTVNLSVYGHEGDPPRGKEAVRIIMSESPRVWKASDLVAEVVRRKWIDPNAKHPDAAVRVATARLLRDQVIERVGPGRYRFKLSDDTPSEQTARANDEPKTTTEEGDDMPPPQI